MAGEQRYRIWMRPLWPNVADPRWYPPHVPTKDEGTQEWAATRANELNNLDPWSAWHYEPMPATGSDPVCGVATPTGKCGRPLGHREGCA